MACTWSSSKSRQPSLQDGFFTQCMKWNQINCEMLSGRCIASMSACIGVSFPSVSEFSCWWISRFEQFSSTLMEIAMGSTWQRSRRSTHSCGKVVFHLGSRCTSSLNYEASMSTVMTSISMLGCTKVDFAQGSKVQWPGKSPVWIMPRVQQMVPWN